MRTKRNRHNVRRTRVNLLSSLRRAIAGHVIGRLVLYLPALVPLVLFILAHTVTLVTLILIKSGVMPQGQVMHKTLVTWAVYGFLPLLICSYGCFFAVARPVTATLARRFPDWMPATLTLAGGTAYGLAVTAALMYLLEPASPLRVLFLLAIGMATGLGNWWVYRKLTVAAVQEVQPSTEHGSA